MELQIIIHDLLLLQMGVCRTALNVGLWLPAKAAFQIYPAGDLVRDRRCIASKRMIIEATVCSIWDRGAAA